MKLSLSTVPCSAHFPVGGFWGLSSRQIIHPFAPSVTFVLFSFAFFLFTQISPCHAAPNFDAADITKPDFFPILPWDPYHGWTKTPIEHGPGNDLQSIADCNFNCAGFVLPRDLRECRRLGLGAIMLPTEQSFTNVDYIYQWRGLSDEQIDQRVKNLIKEAGSNPAVKGYFITDEPGARDFPALGKAVAAVKKYAPGKLAYINLFPDYATLGAPDTSQLGTASYTEYLERFIKEVNPQLISYDNYMVQYSFDQKDRGKVASYYHNLLAVRAVGLKYHLPYLNIVSGSQIVRDVPPPSPADTLLQAYTTLAAGYRGVTWYTYYSGGYNYAPIDLKGRKTPTWAWMKEVNGQVAALAPIMSRLDSTGVFFSAPAPADNLPMLPGELIESVACSTPLMIGEFKHQDGQRYVMIVNLGLESSAKFTIKTRQAISPIQIVSAMDGSLSPFDSQVGLWLTAGQGVLLQLGK